MDVGLWLHNLGLGTYARSFADNAIDAAALLQLDDADLRELGVAALGHRKRLLAAIAALAKDAVTTSPPETIDRSGGERRQLTVLFCDIVGSTEIAASMDPEEYRDLIQGFQDRCIAIFRRYDGSLAKFLGDGAMACFGLPAAHEDDAERAVRAALELVATLSAPEPRSGRGLAVRAAVATGLVVTNVPADGGRPGEIVGDVPNLAARLQQEAPANAVVVSPATLRLLGDMFDYESLGPRTLRGVPRPVVVTRVLRERPVDSRFAAVRAARLSPFIGRSHEIGLLLERWQLAVDGEGQVALLIGEPGIGKSRLVEAFHDNLASEPHLRIRYQCSPHHANSAFFPAIAHLTLASRIAPDDPPGTKLAKLAALTAQAGPAHAEDAPFLADLMGIPVDENAPIASLTPQQKKNRLQQILNSQLFDLARQQSVLLVLEDAHWIDPSTHELFDSTVSSLSRARVMCVVTARPEFGVPWSEHAYTTVLRMNRLGQRQCTELVTRMAASRRLPETVVREIVARGDGIPLFVEELTRSVLEQPEDSGGAGRIESETVQAVPASLHDSLMGRLDRMSAAKDVAQVAAVIGREFTLGLLVALSGVPSEALSDTLGHLEAAGIVSRRSDSSDTTYVFKHALIQEVAHGSLLRSRLERLHGRLADILDRADPGLPSAEPEIIAHHYSEARQPQRAVPLWLQAGRRASARSAFLESIAHLRRGLATAADMPAGEQRSDLEIDLQIALAMAYIASRGYAAEETRQAYADAHSLLAERRQDPRQFAVLYGLFVTTFNLARLSEAIVFAQALIARGGDAADAAALCTGHRSLAVAYNPMGRFADARDQALKAWAYYDPVQHPKLADQYGNELGVAAQCHLMIANRFLGAEEAAHAAEQRALAIARDVGHANSIGYTWMWVAFSQLAARRIDEARRLSDSLLAFASERQMAAWSIMARLILAGTLAECDARRSLALLRDVRQERERLRVAMFESLVQCVETSAQTTVGDAVAALAAADRGLAVSEATGEHWWDAELHRHRARALLTRDGAAGLVEADLALRAAMQIADGQGARPLRLRAAVDLARLLAETGQRRDARALLSAVSADLDGPVIIPEVAQARVLLDALT